MWYRQLFDRNDLLGSLNLHILASVLILRAKLLILRKLSCLFLCMVFLVASAQDGLCNVIPINKEKAFIVFSNDMKIANIRNQNVSMDLLIADNSPYFNSMHNALSAGESYWAKFDVVNNLSKSEIQEFVLDFSILLTKVNVFVSYSNGIAEHKRTGFFLPIDERDFKPVIKGNVVKIRLPFGEKVTILFEAKCERIGVVPALDLEISSLDEYNRILQKEKQFVGFFVGFLAMLLVYNLFLYFYTGRDLAYVYYSAYLLFIIFFSLYNSGDLADFIAPIFFSDRPEWMHFGKTSVYFVILFYITFLRKFLDTAYKLPKWDLLLKWVAVITMPLALLDSLLMFYSNFNSDLSDIVPVGTTLVFMISVGSFCYAIIRAKNKNGYFIVVGTSLMMLGTMMTIFSRFQGVDFTTSYLRIGIVLEVVIFSLGLAFRRRETENQKQAAFFELEKNKLLQDQKHAENERMKQLDQLKTKLYTNITHEFRTPLTVIMGMNDNISGYPKEKEYIQRNASQLLRLVNQMLDLSKIESERMPINYINIDVVNYLEYLNESFHSLADSKRIDLIFYSERKEIWMDVDEQKLEVICYNLLSNAIKFSKEGSKVAFQVKELKTLQGTMLQIVVMDDGDGIDDTDLGSIFDRFYRSEKSVNSSGTGIGLSLVKEVVELLEGEINVKSEIGLGTKFTILLPIRNLAEKTKGSGITKSNFDIAPTFVGDVVDNLLLEAKRAHILLVEDNSDVAEYIQSFLATKYQITVCTDGINGVDKSIELIPDLIISDVAMPGRDGYELTRLLKNDERTCHIPIILLTAKTTQEEKILGLESGADAFLSKPFHKKELLIRIQNLQSASKQIIENYEMISSTNNISDSSSLSLDDVFLDKLRKFIVLNVEDGNLGGEDIGKEFNLSQNQSYRKVKALTGLTITLFVRSVRLELALNMLRNGDMNVSEIAYKVGFNDPSYFSRVFYKQYSKTPSEILSTVK